MFSIYICDLHLWKKLGNWSVVHHLFLR